MKTRLEIIVAVILLVGLLYVVNQVRKKKLEVRYALIWLILGFGILLFDIVPGLMEWTASLLGIATPVNMLFFLGFLFSLLIIYSLTKTVSQLSNRVKCLTQQLAFLEKELYDRERK